MLQEPWLEAYLKYVSETEAPEAYRYWAGVSAISTTLKRNIKIQRGFIDVFANQYICLVGPPGVGKGTAMNPAVELVREANVAHYMEDRVTAERATELLAAGFPYTRPNPNGGVNMGTDHCATAVAPELSIFLGASEWMLQFLCTLWDKNKFTYDTKKGKTTVIDNLSFGLLGACTPDYIRKINKDVYAAVAGGFTSRTIFVFASKKGKTIAWPDPNISGLKDPLIHDLRLISQLQGDMKFSNHAKDMFIDFYKNNDVGVDDFETEVLANFRARMWSHVMKHAMVLSVSERDDLEIHETQMTRAIDEVTKVFTSLDVTFRGVGESDLAENIDRIMKFIEGKGVCTRSAIMRANFRHITDEDLTRVLYTLCSIGFCTEFTSGSSMTYKHNKNFKAAQAAKNVQTKGATP